MKRVVIIIGLFLLSGCTGLVHELKTDPAIVGITGWWFSVGVEASPSSGGIPFPVIKTGYGTIWRVGITDEAEIQVGQGVQDGGVGQKATPSKLDTQASLSIKTKNTSKALEKMKDIIK